MIQATDSTDLPAFFEGLEPATTERVRWRGGQMELDLAVFLTGRIPPAHLITSGRCIVTSGDSVLLMTNPSGDHILPGGRRTPGEDLATATARELAEETGLQLFNPELIATLVYTHVTPKPQVYPYPYPVFLNAVFVQRLSEPIAIQVDDTYELAGEFVPIGQAIDRIPHHQQVLLNAVRQQGTTCQGPGAHVVINQTAKHKSAA